MGRGPQNGAFVNDPSGGGAFKRDRLRARTGLLFALPMYHFPISGCSIGGGGRFVWLALRNNGGVASPARTHIKLRQVQLIRPRGHFKSEGGGGADPEGDQLMGGGPSLSPSSAVSSLL